MWGEKYKYIVLEYACYAQFTWKNRMLCSNPYWSSVYLFLRIHPPNMIRNKIKSQQIASNAKRQYQISSKYVQ
jgi:hypothetical protein